MTKINIKVKNLSTYPHFDNFQQIVEKNQKTIHCGYVNNLFFFLIIYRGLKQAYISTKTNNNKIIINKKEFL